MARFRRLFRRMAWFRPAGGFLRRAAEAMAQTRDQIGVPARATRIRDVEVFPYALRQKVVVKTALGESPSEGFFVRLRTEEGVVGYGEGCPFPPVTAETQGSAVVMARALGEILRGRDPFSVAHIAADMETFAPHNPSSKAALEMALWDICGKLAGRPVCDLLGRYRDSFETDKTVFLQPPEAMARAAADAVRDKFAVIKVKVGESPELDVARLRAIRDAVGPSVKIRVDANQGWTPAEAVKCLRGIEQYQIEFAEQPVVSWDWPGMKFVRDAAPMPVMADESVHAAHDAIEGIRRDAMDMINIKLMKSGGILAGSAIATVAGAANLKCMVGCMMETRLALTAAAHLVCARESILYADLDAALFLAEDPIIGGMDLTDGIVTLPRAPGLGLDVDPAFVARLRAA